MRKLRLSNLPHDGHTAVRGGRGVPALGFLTQCQASGLLHDAARVSPWTGPVIARPRSDSCVTENQLAVGSS